MGQIYGILVRSINLILRQSRCQIVHSCIRQSVGIPGILSEGIHNLFVDRSFELIPGIQNRFTVLPNWAWTPGADLY